MTKKITTISLLVLSIILISFYIVKSTYSIIDNLIDVEKGEVTISNILKSENGEYRELYYEIKRELNITYEEYNTLITSVPINKALDTLLNNNFTENDTYNLIVDSIMEDDNIDNMVKEKVINSIGIYIKDIYSYLNKIKKKN